MFEKTTTNKKIMHGLHNMFYFERKKHALLVPYLLVGICLPKSGPYPEN